MFFLYFCKFILILDIIFVKYRNMKILTTFQKMLLLICCVCGSFNLNAREIAVQNIQNSSVSTILMDVCSSKSVDECDYYDTLTVCRNSLPIIIDKDTINDAGEYTLRYASDIECDSIVHLTVRVNENPEPQICGNSAHCDQTPIQVWLDYDYPHILWSTGDTTFATFCTDSSCQVEVIDSVGCVGTASKQFAIYPLPDISVVGDSVLCMHDTAIFVASGGTSYVWYDRSDIFLSNKDTLVYVSRSDKAYTEHLTLYGYGPNNCARLIHKAITVFDSYETNDTVMLCRNELPYYKDSVRYDSAGVYTIYNQSQDGCDSLTKLHIIVNELPVVKITGNDSLCLGERAILTANGAYTYIWNTGSVDDSIEVFTADWYSVVGTDTNGCSSTDSIFVRELPVPVIKITGDSTVCHGNSMVLTATGGTKYLWSTGSTDSSIVVTPLHDTLYSVTAITRHGCSGTADFEVSVLPVYDTTVQHSCCRSELPYVFLDSLIYDSGIHVFYLKSQTDCDSIVRLSLDILENPDIVVTGETGACFGKSTILTASGAAAYIWNTLAISNSIIAEANNWYWVMGISSNGCNSVDTIFVEQYPTPQATIEGNDWLCYGDTTTLTATGGNSYIWTTGETQSSILIHPLFNTTYGVMVTNNYGCTSTTSIEVEVKPLYDTTIVRFCCQNELPYIFNGQPYYESGLFEQKYVSEFGCDSIIHLDLTVYALPEVKIIGVDSLCSDEMTALTASGANTYLWSTASNKISIVARPGQQYWLQGTDSHGCRAYDTIFIRELTLPQLVITGEKEICHGSFTTLTAEGGLYYQWSTGESTAAIEVSPTENTNYTVVASNIHGCTASTSTSVVVHAVYESSITVNCCRNDLPYRYHGQEYTQPGTYDVHLFSIFGCDSIVHLTLNINENPNAFVTGNRYICPGASTQLSANGNGTYLWNTGESQPSIWVSTPGWYVLTVTAVNGCKSYDSLEVTHLPVPEISISGEESVCLGSSVTLTASGAATYYWNTGAPGSILTVTPSQTTNYVVIGTSDRGCSATASKTVRVNDKPVASILGPNTICEGEVATLTATGGAHYLWSTGETTSTIQATTSQVYSVTVTNEGGCSATAQHQLIVNMNPTVSISGQDYFCAGSSTTLTAYGNNIVSYMWSNGVPGQSIQASSSGIYTVVATASGNCTASASVNVVMHENPTVQVSGELSFCDGQHTTLSASGGNTYSWKNAYGLEISTSNEITINEGGSYSVTAVNTYGCSNTLPLIIIKKALPNATIFASDYEVCQGVVVNLRAGMASEYSYLWSTGSTDRQIAVTQSGTYKLYVFANGCTASDSVDITVHPLPAITFSGDSIICIGMSTTIYASAPNAISYRWNIADNASDHITVSPTVTTNYSVSVTDIHTCSNDAKIRVSVLDLPRPAILGVDSMCVGDSILWMATGGVSYLWNDGDTSSLKYIKNADEYSVIAMNEGGCTAIASKRAYFYDSPHIFISGNTQICLGDSTVLTAHGGKAYRWNDGTTDSTLLVTAPGTYSVEVWNDHLCSASASIQVHSYDLPMVQITGDSIACDGYSATLTASSPTAVEYLWNNGMTSPQIIVSESGDYSVMVLDANFCHAESTFHFEVLPVPSCTIIGDTMSCAGDTLVLTAANGTSFLWSTGDTTSSITVSPDTTTCYHLTIYDENGCAAHDSLTVNVYRYKLITITGDDGFCEGDSTWLVASGAHNYIWSTGQTGDSILVKQSGDYTVFSTDINTCFTPATKHVTQHNFPEITINGPSDICFGDTAVLQAVSNTNVSYLWSNLSTDSVIRVTTSNVYNVTVVDNYGCANSASKLLMVHSAPTGVSIQGPSTAVCRGDSVQLTVLGNATHYAWSTGDSTQTIRLKALYSNTYNVIASTNYGCSATASYVMSVNAVPVVTITGDTAACEGSSVTLSSSNAQSFHWSTGSSNRSITVTTTGNYTVTVSNSYGCTSSASHFVHFYEHPNASISGDSVLCYGESTVLTANGSGSYHWNTGSTEPFIMVTPEETTVYSLQVSNAYCTSSATYTVVVNPNPIAIIQGPDYLCEGKTIILTAQGGNSYLWNDGQTTASIMVSEAGLYSVVAYNEFGCSDIAEHIVTLSPTPQILISGPDFLCAGSTEQISAIGNGTFLWNTGDTTPTITIGSAGIYQVQLTNSYGCTSSASHNVINATTPSITILGPDETCEGETVTLSVICYNANSFSWSTGAVTPTIEVSPNTSTNYFVIANSENCIAQENHLLTVNSSYIHEFSAEICQGQSYSGQGFNIPTQDESGTFTFIDSLQSSHGCDSMRILYLTVKALPVITTAIVGNSTIFSPGNYVYTIAPVENTNSYEWIITNPQWTVSFNQNIAQVTVTSPGTAQLQVYALNDCGQSLPQTLQITYGTGINDNDISSIRVYPNPTNGMITIASESTDVDRLEIYDLYGKKLTETQFVGSEMQFDMGQYAAGVYFFKLKNTKTHSEAMVKVVKN